MGKGKDIYTFIDIRKMMNEEVNFGKLTNYPDYLEKNKMCIDEWINKLIFSNLTGEK